jgi:hypothetical protein
MALSLKTDVNVLTVRVSKKQRNLFFDGILKATEELSRIRIQINHPVYESKDPYPSQNETDPEHCL